MTQKTVEYTIKLNEENLSIAKIFAGVMNATLAEIIDKALLEFFAANKSTIMWKLSSMMDKLWGNNAHANPVPEIKQKRKYVRRSKEEIAKEKAMKKITGKRKYTKKISPTIESSTGTNNVIRNDYDKKDYRRIFLADDDIKRLDLPPGISYTLRQHYLGTIWKLCRAGKERIAKLNGISIDSLNLIELALEGSNCSLAK